jgi:endonuclease YncB( thermonuclease family)
LQGFHPSPEPLDQALPRSNQIFLFSVPLASLICLVVAIHDGDTLTARCGSPANYQQVRLRVAAIDAPETRQAFGQKSREHLARLCFRQQATLQPVDKDKYGRMVAHVRCAGTDVAAAQVSAGMAWVYAPYAADQPGLTVLQDRARAQRTGLWSQPRPQAPWTYRHQHAR